MSKHIIKLIKELRKHTKISIIDCKKILEKNNYNIHTSIQNINNLQKIYKPKTNEFLLKEGAIFAGISQDNKFGALLKLKCETDFVSKNKLFLSIGKQITQNIISKKIYNIEQIKKIYKKNIIDIRNKTKENIYISEIKTLKGNQINYYLHMHKIGALVSTENDYNNFSKKIAMQIVASKPKYLSINNIPKNSINNKLCFQTKIKHKNENSKIKNTYENIEQHCLLNQKFIMNPEKKIHEIINEKKIKIVDFAILEINKSKQII